MGNLLIHALLFIFGTAATTNAVRDYRKCTDIRGFKVGIFDMLAYQLNFLSFITMATINFSYFAYQLAIVLNCFRIVNVFFFYIAFKDSKNTTLYILLSANIIKTLYTLYVLLIFRRDAYQVTFKQFGSNLALYSK